MGGGGGGENLTKSLLLRKSENLLFFWLLKSSGHQGRDTRCDKSQVASSALLLQQVACSCFAAAICRTNSNQFEFVRQIAATMIFTCHTRRFVAKTCRGDVSQRFVASCVSALKVYRVRLIHVSFKCFEPRPYLVCHVTTIENV